MSNFRMAGGIAVTGLVLGVALAGCGSGSNSGSGGSGGAGSKTVVTIGYENAPDPEAVAIEQNFFKKYMKNATVKMKYFSDGPKALTAMASGKLDFMTTLGNPPTASAIARGVPLKVVWAMERYTTGEGLVVTKSSGITSLKGLEGKKVALVQGSTSPFELETALKNAGIPVSSVTQVNMTPPDMVAAWKKGSIQAAYVWTPFDNAMQNSSQHPGKFIMYDQNVYKQAPIFNLAVVNSHWAKSHKSLVQGFVKAEQAGYTFYKSHPQKAYKDMAKLNNISAANAQSQTKGFQFENLKAQVSANGMGSGSSVKNSLVTKSLASAAKWLAQTGQIPKDPSNIAQYVDPSFAQAVLNGK